MYAKESQELFEEPKHIGHMSRKVPFICQTIRFQRSLSIKRLTLGEQIFSTYLLAPGANPMV
jgi:hypothetical protein